MHNPMDIFDMFFGGGHRGSREKRTKDMVYPLRVRRHVAFMLRAVWFIENRIGILHVSYPEGNFCVDHLWPCSAGKLHVQRYNRSSSLRVNGPNKNGVQSYPAGKFHVDHLWPCSVGKLHVHVSAAERITLHRVKSE